MYRVSSDEQKKGYSLDDQYNRLVNYCKKNNYEIVYEISEDYSAKTFNRPEWNKWMEHIKKKRVKIDAILFTSWDRFSRNLTEALNMVDYLREKKNITPQAIEQPIDYDIPEQLFVLSFYLTNPDVDNRRRSIKVKGGIRQGLKQGRWTKRPYYGYMSSKDEQGKHLLVPDPEKAPIVQEIFERVSKEEPQIEIIKDLAERGIKISKNGIHVILKRIGYAGKIIVPEHEEEPVQIVHAVHEPIISESLFYAVQAILERNKKKRNKDIPKYNKLRNDFHLRGVINCNTCGHVLTSSFSKGRHGGRFGYYHCNKCKGQRVPATKVHTAFYDLLGSLSISPEMNKVYQAVLTSISLSGEKRNKQDAKAINKQIDQINERINRLQDLMLNGKLEIEDYQSMRARYVVQLDELTDKKKELSQDNKRVISLTQNAITILSNILETYENATVQLKQKIVGSIFGENLIFENGIFRTPQLNQVFTLLSSINGDYVEKEKGQQAFNSLLSPTAVRRGFEPRVRLHVRLFSKQVLSATQAPHLLK